MMEIMEPPTQTKLRCHDPNPARVPSAVTRAPGRTEWGAIVGLQEYVDEAPNVARDEGSIRGGRERLFAPARQRG